MRNERYTCNMLEIWIPCKDLAYVLCRLEVTCQVVIYTVTNMQILCWVKHETNVKSVGKMPNYTLKYNSVYCSQINHCIQKICQYPGLSPPTNIKLDSFTISMLLMGIHLFWIYLSNEVLLQGS